MSFASVHRLANADAMSEAPFTFLKLRLLSSVAR